MRWSFICLLALSSATLSAAEPERGQRMLDAYFRRQVQDIADHCLVDVKDRADWERRRPELHRQFLEMLGLWPLPPRTDLKPVITGTIDAEHFTVEKLHFQSSPGLYVIGNLYLPKASRERKRPEKYPAVLYVCGHGNTVIDRVSYGSKVNYQHHAAWLAEHGYVCLILDTLQLNEIPGLHHGTSRFGMWWWQTLGYTPAGIECWNAMRALDYLESRKEVDARRLGVTGRSGGGATSWWIAAADERVKCVIPVAGIVDLHSHLVAGVAARFHKGVISGHCDCMYHVNTYRWDFPMVAALIAPRPLLLGNSDVDDIFPVPGYRGLADKVHRIYDLYGAGERFTLLETAGPHKDSPELRQGAFRWLNRWLKDQDGPVTEEERPRFTPQQLKVLPRAPEDALNATIHEYFIKPAKLDLPESAEVTRAWWEGKRPELMKELKEKVFAGWPSREPALNLVRAADIAKHGLRLRAFDFQSEEEVPLRLWLLTAEKTEKPKLTVLTAVDEAGWQEFGRSLGPEFHDALLLSEAPVLDREAFERNRRVLEKFGRAFATLTPRGVGPTRWLPYGNEKEENHIRRRFALLGQTVDGQRAWDVRRGLAVLRRVDDLQGTALWLQGQGDLAGIVLYAGLFEPDVVRFDLHRPPASHRQGPIFLNVRRVLDLPQAAALAFPRAVRIYVDREEEMKSWEWPLQLQKALGQEHLAIRRRTP
jgi:hypothetical protein